MLRVTLMGNLGSDPEVRQSQKVLAVAMASVAVNQVRSRPNGEREESTEWFRVRAMGRLVEIMQRLAKGTRVLVVGRLDIGHYQSSDGERRTSFDVWADDIVALGAPREPGSHAVPTAGTSRAAAEGSATPNRQAISPASRAAGPPEPPVAEQPDDLPW